MSYKNEYWYCELKSYIQSVHSAHYKTVLITGPDLYLVVTRVNYTVIKLWVDFVNSILAANPQIQVDKIQRIGWLVMQKQYRRDLQNEILNHPKLSKP